MAGNKKKTKSLTSKQKIAGLAKALNDILGLLADESNPDFTLNLYETANVALAKYASTPVQARVQARFYENMAKKLGVTPDVLPEMRYSELSKLLAKKGLILKFVGK